MAERVRLHDGRTVLIRPLVPEDRTALSTMYEGLSDESRHRRFMAVHPHLGEQELDYLTQIDHHDHEALVAFADEGGRPGPMVGVVRYVRTTDGEAEPAMLIDDRWQGVGLCGEMLERLVARAWAESIRRFRAPVLAYNEAALRSLDRLGDSEHHRVGSEIEVEIALREPERPARRVRRTRRGRGRPRPTLQAVGAELTPRAEPPDGPHRNVLVVGVAEDDRAQALVATAGELALALGSSVLLVTAARRRLADATTAELERLAAPLREQGVEVELLVRSGTAAALLVAVATERAARMVLLASGGPADRRGAGTVRGAIGDLVTRQAPCDVLLLRGV